MLLAGACGGSPSPGSDPARTLAIMKKAETPDKLLADGKAFAALGDTTRAEEYFTAAVAQGGDEPKIIPLIIEVCVRDGRYELAIEHASRYARKHPFDVRMRYVLGTLYAAIGDAGHARAELEFVVQAKPNDPEPHWALAKVLHDEAKDPLSADGQYREYLRLAPTGSHADEARASITNTESPQP
jgi:tetratricopeptide (TPR) repeat protein